MSDNQAQPLVTIAMPVYNAGNYLRVAVLSIIGQTFTNWELLIIDDGSTDNAFQSIADIEDARIQILHDGKNKGLAVRLNECIDLARGQFFARMDQDDISYPERLMRQIAFFSTHPKLDLLAVRAITIDENDKVIGLFPSAITHDEICTRPWLGFYFPHPTWMGKTAWFRQHRYAMSAPFCCEDQELLLRSYHDSQLTTLDEVLFAYRLRDKVNWQKLARTRCAVFAMQLRHFVNLNQWHFVLLATVAFVGKMSSDFFQRLRGSDFQPKSSSIDNRVALEWQTVFEDIKRL